MVARIDRRRFIQLSSGAVIGLAACSGDDDAATTTSSSPSTSGPPDPGPTVAPTTAPAPTTVAPTSPPTTEPVAPSLLAAPGSPGLVDEALFQERIEARLATARDAALSPGSQTNVAAHLIAAHRDPDYDWAIGDVTVAGFQDVFDKIDAWEDTRDFDLMYLTWVHALGRGDTPTTQLAPAVIAAIEQRMVDNRYRYDDPYPDERLDNLWFWSENHRIINLAIEYLAGQALPGETFTITGLTGAEHMDRAKPDILDWIDERGRFGFFEWHSNVYMLKNITPLHMLVELCDDDEIVLAAAMALDLCVLDMASHLQSGGYCAPHGRTYKKDKMSALDEDTFNVAKFLFDDTSEPYTGTTDNGGTYMCASQRWRPPQVLVDIAVDDTEHVVRERHGIFVDGMAPLTPETPEAPFGYDFDDPESIKVWWAMGGLGLWQFVRTGMAESDEHRLWDTELFTQVKAMADLNGRDPEATRAWVQEYAEIVNFGFLGEANTYAYRHPAVSMASVIDHRAGQMRDQGHAWKAQIDEHALVFTTHPLTEPVESTEWNDDGDPGYWTGEASMPRSAQHRRTSIHVYRPLWDQESAGVLWGVFPYRDYTHAYFPQDHFDRVIQAGNWTVGAKGDGYIALWSWRTPTWREYDPAVHATRGMVQPFDLVAQGGSDNVWICEVGNAADDGSLDDFVVAVTANEPVVDASDGVLVRWASPSSGLVELTEAGLAVDGADVPTGDFPRHESPWGTIDRLSPVHSLATPSNGWQLDFEAMTRTVT